MLNQIYKTIKKYDTIVIARHIGVDPDAMASQIALRDAILLTFPKRKSMLWVVEVVSSLILENWTN